MKSFEYHAPQTREDAVALLGSLQGTASLLAGGTDLLVEIKENLRRPECLIDLANIPGLNELSYDPVRGLSIGAMVTVNQVAASPAVLRHYPALAYAAGKLGSPQGAQPGHGGREYLPGSAFSRHPSAPDRCRCGGKAVWARR